MTFRYSVILAAAMTITACASSSNSGKRASTPPPPPPPPAAEYPAEEPEVAASRGLGDYSAFPAPAAGRQNVDSAAPDKDYLPFIDVAIDREAVEAEYGDMLQDRYTRIQVVTIKPDAYDQQSLIDGSRDTSVDRRNYDDESRGWLSRMMGSRSVTRTLIAEFDVSQPNISATKALFSASFKSNRQEGESWSTNESISVYATPYFKVNANTTIEARFRMQLADERENVAPANVLSALTTAANAISPTSALLTYFSAPRMEVASNFLNSSVSTLFGQSITEESVSAFSVKTWTGRPIIIMRAELPDARNIKDTDDNGAVGAWAVYLDEPIPSIFSSTPGYDVDGNDAADFSDVTAGEIFAFKLGEDITVYDYIFSRLDLADRISDLNATGNVDVAHLICTRIERGLAEVGLTSIDAAAGVWAAAESDQFTRAASAILKNPETCSAAELWVRNNG